MMEFSEHVNKTKSSLTLSFDRNNNDGVFWTCQARQSQAGITVMEFSEHVNKTKSSLTLSFDRNNNDGKASLINDRNC